MRPGSSHLRVPSRFVALATTVALAVSLTSVLAAPAAHADAPQNSSPIKVEFAHADGPAGREDGGLAIVTCYSDATHAATVPCLAAEYGLFTDATDRSESEVFGKLVLAWDLPDTVGSYSVNIWAAPEGGGDPFPTHVIAGQTYDPAAGAVVVKPPNRVDFGVDFRGFTRTGDTNDATYEYVVVTERGTVGVSSKVGSLQQYRIPNVTNTDKGKYWAIGHAPDGRSTLDPTARDPYTQAHLDTKPWTLGEITLPPAAKAGAVVPVTVTCQDVDRNAVDCLRFSVLKASGGSTETVVATDADPDTPGTQFTVDVGAENTVTVSLHTMNSAASPLSQESVTIPVDKPADPKPETPEPGPVVLGKLGASDFSPTGGQKVKVTGTVTRDGKPVAGQKVTVKYRKVKATWKTKRVTTDANGRYTVTVKSNRAFRAYAALGEQKSRRVLVRPIAKVTLSATNGSVSVKTVGYAKKAPKVRIQAKRDGRWVTVAKGRAFRAITVEVKDGTKLRAVSEKTRWVRSGKSKTVRFS